MTVIRLILLVSLICSCSKQQAHNDVAIVGPAQNKLPASVASILSKKIPEWNRWLATDTGADFSWEKYLLRHSLHFYNQTPFQDSDSGYAVYEPFLLYNLDSSYALNIYATMWFEKKNGKVHYVGSGDPEPAILLLNRKKQFIELFTGGTPTHFMDGIWIDSTTVAVVGYEFEYETKYNHPFVYLFNLSDRTIQYFSSPDSTVQPLYRYIAIEKMKDIVFDE